MPEVPSQPAVAIYSLVKSGLDQRWFDTENSTETPLLGKTTRSEVFFAVRELSGRSYPLFRTTAAGKTKLERQSLGQLDAP
jgi:hypothetical protein